MNRRKAIEIPADKLPPVLLDALDRYRRQGVEEWQGVASSINDVIAEVEATGYAVNKSALYATIASLVGKSSNTVRQWAGTYARVEPLILKYQDTTFEQWRSLCALATKSKESVISLTERLMDEAAKEGYTEPSVDKLLAILSGGAERLDAPKSAKTLDRLARAANAHGKAVMVGDSGVQPGQREAWEVVWSVWSDYAAKFGEQETAQ